MSVATAARRLAPDQLDEPLPKALPELGRGTVTMRRLRIATPRQALFYLPSRYDDFSELRPLGELVPDEKQSAEVRVTGVRVEPGFGRRPQRVIAQLADETGSAEAIWFGRRFVERRVQAGDRLVVSGKVTMRGWRPQFTSPDFSPVGRESVHTGRVVPVYPLVGGVTQRRVRELLARILERSLDALDDPLLPAERGALPELRAALRSVHFPNDTADVRPALDRLAFDELLALQLTLAQARAARERLVAPALGVPAVELRGIVDALPFRLTGDQERAVAEIAADLATDRPMRRLLQGDVGSGKTAVAAVALAVACRAGRQGALMAPTEILARQHHHNLAPLLERMGIGVEFLSGGLSAREKRRIHAGLEAGEVGVVIGTHAVISEAVSFAGLGLAVVDEQHRFGVAQRAALQAKGDAEPHVLALTATPIPRTLALTFYGDLSISTLRELPPGRQPVRTEIRGRAALPRIEAFLAGEAADGRQAFVVVPLIVESEALQAASAEAEHARLTEALPKLRIGLVHGQQRGEQRDETMQGFAGGELDLLVATTVVEVGIDVPNASVMLVEDAERFGLAQLHQLRGRVGRGPHRSWCILLSDALDDELVRRRLEVVRGSRDGFAIAEADLALRGPGNLLGTRQSGLPPLRVASLFDPRHVRLAERARRLSQALVASDPALARRPGLARLRRDFAPVEAAGDAA